MRACWPPMGVRSTSDRLHWKGGAGAFALALLCILVIALAQRHGWLDGINIRLMTLAGETRDTAAGRALMPVMQGASAIGGTAARFSLLFLVVLGLWWGGRRHAMRWLVLTVLAGTVLNVALKQVFAEPRPDLLPHLDIVHTYSFPSGHAAGNMILFGALALLLGRRSGYGVAVAVIALIGASRVWLGVHWPSDVLAGWIEGLGWLALCAVWLPARRSGPAG